MTKRPFDHVDDVDVDCILDEMFAPFEDTCAPLSQPVYDTFATDDKTVPDLRYLGLQTKFPRIGGSMLHPEKQIPEECDCPPLTPNAADGIGRYCVRNADWEMLAGLGRYFKFIPTQAKMLVWPHGMNGKEMHPTCVTAYYNWMLNSDDIRESCKLPCADPDNCAVKVLCGLRVDYYKSIRHHNPCMCLDKLVASIALYGPDMWPGACDVFDCCFRHTKKSVVWQPHLFTILTFISMLRVCQLNIAFK